MRAASVSTAFAASLLGVALSPLAAAQASCTTEQVESYSQMRTDVLPVKCKLQWYFDACDDDCFNARKEILARTPNCTISMGSLTDEPVRDFDKCESYHPTPKGIYMPQPSTGLSKCSTAQKDQWEATYGVHSVFDTCAERATKYTGCADSCLHTLEEGIQNTPACADGSGYWWGEYHKIDLVECIHARGEKIANNIVLNTVLNGDGSKTVSDRYNATNATNSATTTTQTPVPSTVPVVASNTPVPTTMTAPAASSASSSAGSLAVARVLTASVVATMVVATTAY